MKDKVLVNKCAQDYILWFHLECPKAVAAFDDPNTFKLKFRDMFAHMKMDREMLDTKPEHMERLRLEYDTNAGPDDIRLHTEV